MDRAAGELDTVVLVEGRPSTRFHASTGDLQARQRGDKIVAGLAECQRALGSGYVSAFPQELFDRLRADRPAWAPFYTLHKSMAGLLDMHILAGSASALEG